MLRNRRNVRLGIPCMEWLGLRNKSGHGVLLLPECERMFTHRYAYMRATGVDPGDMYVLHMCDNARCCNVLHLYLGTPQRNMRDRLERGSLSGNRAKAFGPFERSHIKNRYNDTRDPRVDIWTRSIGINE